MNNLFKKAREIIFQNKIDAEAKIDSLSQLLNEDFSWKTNEKNIRKKQVEIGLSKGENREKLQSELGLLLARRRNLLSKRNLTVDSLTPEYKCTLCSDSGFVDEKPCKCLMNEYKKLLFENSNLASREQNFFNNRENNQHNLKVIKKCQQLFDTQNENSEITNLTLFGKTGTGKTFLLHCIGNAFIDRGVEVLFVTSYQLNSGFLARHLGDVGSRQKFLDSLVDVDVLIIDDMGAEQTYKNVTIEYLFAVINQRKLQNKHTLVSTNLTVSQMQEIYDDRIFSRLMDEKDTFIAELVGEDKRLKS